MEAISADVDLPEVDLPECPVSESATRGEIEATAQAVREQWGFAAVETIPSVVGLLEFHGAVVTRLPSVSPAVDAFSKIIEGRPIVVLWAGKDHARARFDAAHELGHLAPLGG